MNLVKDRRCKSKHLSYYDVVEDTDEVTITSEKTRGEYICITKKLKLVKASKVNEKSSHAVIRNLKHALPRFHTLLSQMIAVVKKDVHHIGLSIESMNTKRKC